MQTLPYVVIAFCGFEVVATLTEESKNPTKDIPHALIGAAIFLTVLFGAFATVLYGLFPADGFVELGTDAPLIVVGGSLFGLAGIVWMTIHCFTGSMSTANGGVMGQTRVLYAMAREGWFPRSFSKLDENGTPTTALLVTAVSIDLGLVPADRDAGRLDACGLPGRVRLWPVLHVRMWAAHLPAR